MATRFSVFAQFSARDKMTRALRKMANSNSRFTKQIRRDYAQASHAADKFTRSLNKRVNTAMKRTAQIGGVALAGGLAMATKQYIDFDDAIFGATAKMGDLDLTTEKGRKTMEAMRKVARKVGAETQFTAVEAAQGLEFLAMAGFSAEQSMKLLPGVSNLATVANVDFARATDIASDALGAFGKMTTDTAQLEKNFIQVQDQMATTVNKTNTTMEDLFEAIKFGAPGFTAAGQSMSTFNAIVGRMASSGIKGSNAGTAMRSAITRLQKPTKEVSQGLAMFGLSASGIVKDGKLMDMVDIMAMMEKNGKKMTAVQRNAALTMIVGKNAVSGWAAVMNEGVDNTIQLKKQLEGSSGAAQRMSAIIRQSLGNKIKSAISALTDKAFEFLSTFDSQGRSGLDGFIEAIRKFDVKPIVRGLKMLFDIISFIYKIIKPFIPVIITFIALWKTYKTVLMAVKTAQLIFNAVMAANPIGLAVAGVIALIVAIKDLYENWDLYSLNFKLKLHELLLGWKAIKYEVQNLMVTLGMLDKAVAQQSFKDLGKSLIEFDTMQLERMQLMKSKGLETGPVHLRSIDRTIGGAPITQREAVQTSIEKKTSEQILNIRNNSNNEADMKGQRIPPGQSMRVLPNSG